MSGHERNNVVIAQFTLPAVLEGNTWKYSALRFVVTDTANQFLVQYITQMVRS